MRIYSLHDPQTDELRYIGITRSALTSRLGNHTRKARAGEKSYRAAWIRNLLKDGMRPIIRTIEEAANPGREVELIAAHRAAGFRLVNTTMGGEGCHGLPEESKARIATALRTRKISEQTRALMSAARKGRTVSESTRKLLSAINQGKKNGPHKPETIEKMRKAKLGHEVTQETRAKLSASLKGRPTGRTKTHCKLGHEYTPENTYQITETRRDCRKCVAIRSIQWQRRRRNGDSASS